ncbi:MAG TPA: C-terminal binding protein [Thermomicrobiales bacterium]
MKGDRVAVHDLGHGGHNARPVVLVTDYAWPDLTIEERVLAEIGARLVVAGAGTAEEIVQHAPEADAILTCWKRVPEAALDAAPRCRIVSRYGIGLDNIPVAHATELGMLVTNVPDFCLDEVADHALALLLACARGIVRFSRETSSGVWNPSAGRALPRLRGQTLGLIGYGAIARNLAPKAAALGLHIVAYTPRISPDDVSPYGRGTRDLDEVLQAADYLSIHAPLTEETRGLIGERALRLMKPTAYLINTSRGAIVDEAALVQALREGWIAGAALDVLPTEPPDPANPLLALENAIVTPHVAFASAAAVEDLRARAAEHVVQVLRGEVPSNLVNPAVLEQPNCRLRRDLPTFPS